MDTVLSEMGALLRAIPAPAASAEDTAAWYERKARLFDHIAEASTTAADADRAAAVAAAARRHAHRLRHAPSAGASSAA
ncbi:hypothetical protein ATK30_4925 [Amycolatopsis echigonensis]|uniref:Uncharacterized protein n=2 Tax=Pseudonocardiaceae TaxID=2070 RepID=A0A2N3WJN1_9PSEU|nr:MULTISPECIES: hypothetical protein [Pseudonocardiaceae]AEA23542.1 hypothetical protein Psed_1299 [Pseudonocardia dioxanivorans CB1190]PKV94056.1 hypothetical protein ATK30_4925 [Amycolatopsis niigatensis]